MIFHWISKKIYMLVALEIRLAGIIKGSRIHPPGIMNIPYVPNFLEVHPTVVELYQFGPEW